MRNFERLALPVLAVVAFIAATPVQASTLIADGITYSLTATALRARPPMSSRSLLRALMARRTPKRAAPG